jgi:hypothetical protein
MYSNTLKLARARTTDIQKLHRWLSASWSSAQFSCAYSVLLRYNLVFHAWFSSDELCLLFLSHGFLFQTQVILTSFPLLAGCLFNRLFVSWFGWLVSSPARPWTDSLKSYTFSTASFLEVSLWWLQSRNIDVFFRSSAIFCQLHVHEVRMSVSPSSEEAVSTPTHWGICVSREGRKFVDSISTNIQRVYPYAINPAFCQIYSAYMNGSFVHSTCYNILTYPQLWISSDPRQTGFGTC